MLHNMETPNTSGDIDVLIAVIQPQENLSDKTFLPHFDIITSALLKIGRSPKFSFYQPSELVDYRNKPPTVNPVLGQRLLNSHFILIDYNLIGPGGVAILRPKFSEVIGGSISDYRWKSNIPKEPFVIGFTESENPAPPKIRLDIFISERGLSKHPNITSDTVPSLLSKAICRMLSN